MLGLIQKESINVDTINKQCASCVFRYFCGSYCRGETISAGENLYSPYIRCSEWKQALIKIPARIAFIVSANKVDFVIS